MQWGYFIFFFFIAELWAEPKSLVIPVVPTEEDIARAKKRFDERVEFIKRPDPIFTIDSPYRFKSQLGRLVYTARGQYINYFEPTEELFLQINSYSESMKQRILMMALGGGALREGMNMMRRSLRKHNIRFVYPNLHGINLYTRIKPIKSYLHARTMAPDDIYVALGFYKSRLTLAYRMRESSDQYRGYLRVYNNWRLVYVRTDYIRTTYNGIGLYKRHKDLYFYAYFQRNFDYPDADRLLFIVNWTLPPVTSILQ